MPDRGKTLLCAVLVALVGALVYANALETPFVFDDLQSIVRNPNVRRLDQPTEAMLAPGGTGASGRPLVALSLAASYELGGLTTFGYHAFNISVHVLCALVLFGLARRTAGHTGSKSALFFATSLAALWAVHPLHTGALNQVVYRNETMMALFFTLTLYAAQRGMEHGARGWFALSVASCALGMTCKENMAAAPLVVLLWDRTFHARTIKGALRSRRGYYAALAATYAVLWWATSLGDRGEAVGFGARDVSSIDYLATQAFVLLHYLRLVVWPHPLILEYSDWPLEDGIAHAVVPGLVLLALLALSLRGVARRHPLGVLGVAAFAVLAPTSSFIPITGAPAAEHRMVLPLAALVAMALYACRNVHRARTAVVVALCIALGVVTWQRNADYSSVLSIWQQTIRHRPSNTLAYEHLTEELMRLGRLPEAEDAFRATLAIDPEQPKANYNFGLLLNARGRATEAQPYFERAIAIDPTLPVQQFHHGWRMLDLRDAAGGMANMLLALEQDATILERERVRQGIIQLAWSFAVAREDELRDPERAFDLLDRIRGQERESTRFLDVLAVTHAARGEIAIALELARDARRRAASAGNARLAAQIDERIRMFERGEPIRVPLTARR